jgi:hypothetical protein
MLPNSSRRCVLDSLALALLEVDSEDLELKVSIVHFAKTYVAL